MRITIDTDQKTLLCEGDGANRRLPLYSDAAFEILSQQWLKVGWNQKYSYTFTWLGRPLIQLPEDVLRIQEVIWRVQPDVILETGVAHGGSLILGATLCKAMGRGRVIGIDIEIRPHNRQAIETHPLGSLITLIEGSSTAPEVVARARSLIKPGEKVLVILDSCHTKAHVRQELEDYHALVTPGSYIVATDGCMRDLYDVPLGKSEWAQDNPVTATEGFLRQHREFVLEQPAWSFNESTLTKGLTYWPSAFLLRQSGPA
jgi:cephalosporin hydroxylase